MSARPASDKQIAFAAKLGGTVEGLDVREASAVIDRLITIRDYGLEAITLVDHSRTTNYYAGNSGTDSTEGAVPAGTRVYVQRDRKTDEPLATDRDGVACWCIAYGDGGYTALPQADVQIGGEAQHPAGTITGPYVRSFVRGRIAGEAPPPADEIERDRGRLADIGTELRKLDAQLARLPRGLPAGPRANAAAALGREIVSRIRTLEGENRELRARVPFDPTGL